LLLLCFFTTFFLSIDVGNALRLTRSLCNDHQWRAHGKYLLLTVFSIFDLPRLMFAFCIIAPFFYNDRMGWQRI
jgi:hypothetical protein